MSDFTVADYASRSTAIIRRRVSLADLPTFFADSLPTVLHAIESQGVTPGGEPFAYYHGVPDGTLDVEAGFPVVGPFAPTGEILLSELPGGRVVTGVHLGPYESVGQTYAGMIAWARAHGLEPTDDMWEVYLTDPEREPDPAHWRTGLFLRVM